MTAPRQILPGAMHLLTRRCSERRFFLRPSRAVNAVFLFLLAVAAQRYGILVHAFCVMSNHYHLLVTDPHTRLPEFMQFLDSLVARAVNARIGHWEGFWSSQGSYSDVVPDAPEDAVRKAAYVLANPVAAGLVRSARVWPGLLSRHEELGCATFVVPRPDGFFRADGPLPESAELTLTLPPGFASAAEFQARVTAELEELEQQARRRLAAQGRSFLGRARVLAQKPFARPATCEPRRKLNPRIAARDLGKRVDALLRLTAFLAAYRGAWLKLREGIRDVVFPAGTYKLRIEHAVRCAPA